MTERYRPNQQNKNLFRTNVDGEQIALPDHDAKRRLLAYRSPEGINPSEISVPGARLLVPRYNIFGIQPMTEYSNRDERATKQSFKEHGDRLLYKNPVLLCAMETNSLMTLALIDGHHRTRFAGVYGINLIPSIVFTPEQATILWNESPDTIEKFENADEFREWIDSGINEALDSFKAMADSRIPKMIPDVATIVDLTEKFESF